MPMSTLRLTVQSRRFRNAGQTCVSANRLYVESSVHDVFFDKFVERVRQLKVRFDPGLAIGPLIDRHAPATIEFHTADTLAKGGAIRCGGDRIGRDGTFFQPTVPATSQGK
ncbi:hypothetical protein AJ88_37865 [Mesorhizobium amorphae CCBAU 01583]|nr:hypothetical protein AJ88_37865 [Mesorhizobium amorphae CCBAU 01583]